MQVTFTIEEKEQFDKLSKEEQSSFFKEKEAHRTNLMLKSVVVTNILIDVLDELEAYNLTKYKLKQTTKLNKVQLEQYIDLNMAVVGKDGSLEVTEYINAVSAQMDKLFE